MMLRMQLKMYAFVLLVSCVSSAFSFTHGNAWNSIQNAKVELHKATSPWERNKLSNAWVHFAKPVTNRNNEANNGLSNSVRDSVLQDIALSVNPCENFYQFACGGYIQNQTIPSGFASKVGDLQGKVVDTVRQALEENINVKLDPQPLLHMKRIYRSCMREAAVEVLGIKSIFAFIDKMGGWPILGIKRKSSFDLEGMLAKAAPFFGVTGVSFVSGGAIIGINVIQDFGKSGRYSIYLDQPGLGQRGFGPLANYELYFLGKERVYNRAYIQFGVEIMVALGANIFKAEKEMHEIFYFELQLARLFLGEKERRRVVERFNKLSIYELSLRYPAFNWLRFFRLLGTTGNSGIHFTAKDSIVLWAKQYYDGLFTVLKQTPERVLANYILWRSILPFIPALGRKFQLISLKYDAAIDGATNPSLPPRPVFCTAVVINNMQWVASRIFVERCLSANVLSKAVEIKQYVRRAFRHEIAKSNWIDQKTRQNALRKFDSIEDNIGFPEYLLNNKFLEIFYKRFDIKGMNFFEDLLEVYVQNYAINLRQLVAPQQDRWLLTPVTTNAVHERGRNAIIMAAAILDEPLIRADYPPALIFGAFGYLTAHEYQHAFDSSGIQFDWNGLINPDFWSRSSAKNFEIKTRCFIKQYSNYFLPDAKLAITNGVKTLDEDLCDNVGLKTAYIAYQAWKADKRFDDMIPGLPFTGDQLFFINAGRLWCSKWSLAFILKFPFIDNHSLNRLRVIGPLQNSVEFSKVFQCPLGSPMNPQKKCSFW